MVWVQSLAIDFIDTLKNSHREGIYIPILFYNWFIHVLHAMVIDSIEQVDIE